MNEISNRFMEAYKSMNLTGYKMGKSSSVITKQKISNIENDKTEVSIDIISDFCKIYKEVDVFYILTGERQMLKEASSSPPNSDAASIYKELYEKKEAELAVSQKRIEELIEHNARLEQELSVFITKKTNVPETESVSDAVEILEPTGTGDL